MKRFILCTLLVIAFGVYDQVQAQFETVVHAWGFSVGGAHGANTGSDQWVLQGRGFLQHELIFPMLSFQLGVGYANLSATGAPPKGYTASTAMADFRLLYTPFSLLNFNPYIYGGFGVTKQLNSGGTDFLPMVPFGLGAQTRISPSTLLNFNAGYNLSLSDKLDGRARTNTDLNALTNQKQDGFYGFTIGLAFTLGGGNTATDETKKKELADAEARRVKQQADAEARRVKQQADAEARRVKQQADADAAARRVKESTDADTRRVKDSTEAVARRVKESTDAEARRVKEATDLEARRLAEQKSRDTIFVLIKGKTVVLRGVNFDFNKATLTMDSEIILWRAYRAMVANPNVRVVITGHTDNVGGQKFNQDLSLKRAQAVKNWLAKKGIKSNRMRTVGRGLNEPVASNETEEGRAQNRRMEFYVQ
jgi:outer membrane protein OmpA-like peptidoglycan-associated protein